MKASLKNKVGTIRNKICELLEDLEERKYELEERDDPEGKWQEEIDEIDNLVYVLEMAESDLYEYE